MTFTRATAAVAVLLAGGLAAQDQGAKGPPAEEKAATRPALPLYWDKLGLTEEQAAEVLKLTAEYRPRRQKLLDELGKLDAEQARRRVSVLTDDQKRKLVDLVGQDPPAAKPAAKPTGKDKAADKDKPKGKAPDK
jgi:hypothetical protein